jgi:hypothetical protein
MNEIVKFIKKELVFMFRLIHILFCEIFIDRW